MIRSYITVPTWVYTMTLLIFHGYLGIGYMTNPPYAQRPDVFSYVLQVFSLNTWGLLILLGSLFTILAAMKQDRVAAISNGIAALPLVVFFPAMFLAEVDGTSARFGSAVLFLIPIVLHAIMARHSWRRNEPVLG